VEVGVASGPTQLKTAHYRMTVMFFALVISKLSQRGIWVSERYPKLDDKEAFKYATNIM